MDTPCRRSDRVSQDDPPDQVGAGASGPRPSITTNRATKACMLAAANMQHTHLTLHSPTSHTTPVGRSIREGPRAWPLHSRDTALVLRCEGLARRHSGCGPHGELSQRIDAAGMQQGWTPRKGDNSTKGDIRRRGPPNTMRRRDNERAACAREATRQQGQRSKGPNITNKHTNKGQQMAQTTQQLHFLPLTRGQFYRNGKNKTQILEFRDKNRRTRT